ncbi:helix-turn-helix domain-containing protein [Rhizobium leguminosarum]|uniref:helix-turn-helix domain-containing protein n=1 Tax=Rhizobium leguminosarum TaxID=384 RepID=UPI001C973CB3|nr:hypothetical protein [Rhizobium leguminosarum]MBY5417662.1 hypothetical protein [Rhizobium leguminosarum]
MSMQANALRDALGQIGLSQVEFARLLDVSVGGVAQWLSGTRPVPGPVEAYVHLFLRLPPSIQVLELQLLRRGNAEMNGMYIIEFEGTGGSGVGTLTFKDGLIYGFDVGGGVYDGKYVPSAVPGVVNVMVSVKMPAGQPSVVGGVVQPFDWTLDVSTEMPVGGREGRLSVSTNLGQGLVANYRRMRELPAAA